MNIRQTSRWFLDVGLFLAFFFCFFLDLTGVDVHQWLGVAGAALAGYHLAVHWDWVVAVGKRFPRGAPGRARLYYVLDAALLSGLAVMGITGIVISTWLRLDLANYDAWLTVHIVSSLIALAALGLKIAYHWRWIVSVGSVALAEVGSAFTVTAAPARPASGARSANGIGRREFVKVMAIMGATSVVAASRAADNLLFPASAQAAAIPTTATAVTSNLPTARTGGTTTGQTTSSATASCTVRCNRRCAYPGKCRKYVDSNGNRLCGLGECL